ncbi:MAG: hypothetical protein WC635_04885 [Bacteriovorax sp.]|jgi:hypothetical protein
MQYLQATNTESPDNLTPRLLKLVLNINILAVIVNFTLNFLGSPTLKYLYLIHIAITLIAVIFFNFSQILPIILTLFFIEGQGRIIWGNAGWTKVIFDSLVFLSVFKIFISNKKIYNLKGLPKSLLTLISLHFFWYLFEFSNLESVSYFAVLASSKIYIYPILFFFGLTQLEFDTSKDKFQQDLNFFFFLLGLELALTFYQFYMKDSFILQISPNYQQAMKDATFAGLFYRPFATAFSPGAISSYFFVTVGFLFFKKKSIPGNILKLILIFSLTAAIILCQVRSSLIKIILIVLLIQIGELVFHRFKAKGFSGIILFSIIMIFGGYYITEKSPMKDDASITYVKDRFSTLGDVKAVQSSRLSFSDFLQIASDKIASKPLGLGPGLTGSVGRLSLEQVKESHFLNIDMLWANDNLIISLLIDFGIGAIFYLSILMYIFLYFFQYLTIFYLKKAQAEFKILLVCFSSVIAILIGSWGTVGLTYNPESFIFWFFAALGFSTIGKFKNIALNQPKLHIVTEETV